ncbi:MAG TPA: flotillin domain-containing protein [Candidatus Thiothrix moscowensis]|uniref:flotillin family protein n=1 Tax=unclassified Thiothrix TaxID=2636184 RepID=UPI0025D5025D|nr:MULTISPECIES: flotillin domain-containing protein [unclassified Thiothrix]HRJ52412.1 flotillin domain-containing protein [Candidatus Thiothrix moscowensis]HRJ92727.1 flotillin domain-containing protein [Candidatus Thiothrix moscowensis]
MDLNLYISLSVGILVLMLLGFALFSAFYKRAQKDTSYVRTGFGGEKIIMGGGAFVLPVLHDVLPINMQTMRIEITREMDQALVTKDPLRVDVTAEFFLRVAPDENAISTAARALGRRTLDENQVKIVFEAPCVAALRSVAAGMELDELHQKRADFEHNVEEAVNAEFRKNGLELVSVSLTRLDQTDKSYFDANNSFDSRGLTILEQIVSENEKRRNNTAQETAVAIKQKNLEATIKKEELDLKEKMTQNERRRQREENEAETQRRIEEINIQKDLMIEQAQQESNIRQAQLEREVSQAWIETNKVKAEFEKISEEIRTARERAEAERARVVEVISAEKEAQRQRIIAEANADVERMAASAAQIRYEVEAAGKRALNEASNLLSNDQIAMQVKMEIVRQLPNIIRESVRPIENIEGIKIMHIDGLNNAMGGGRNSGGDGSAGGNSGGNSLADQVVDSALRYRAQVPLIETLLGEVGLKGGSINDMTRDLRENMRSDNKPDSRPQPNPAREREQPYPRDAAADDDD